MIPNLNMKEKVSEFNSQLKKVCLAEDVFFLTTSIENHHIDKQDGIHILPPFKRLLLNDFMQVSSMLLNLQTECTIPLLNTGRKHFKSIIIVLIIGI